MCYRHFFRFFSSFFCLLSFDAESAGELPRCHMFLGVFKRQEYECLSQRFREEFQVGISATFLFSVMVIFLFFGRLF